MRTVVEHGAGDVEQPIANGAEGGHGCDSLVAMRLLPERWVTGAVLCQAFRHSTGLPHESLCVCPRCF